MIARFSACPVVRPRSFYFSARTYTIASSLRSKLYTGRAESRGARQGMVRMANPPLQTFLLSQPVEIGGPGGEGTNPEQLFACAYAACFGGALNVAAKEINLSVPNTAVVKCQVHLGKKSDEEGLFLEVDMTLDGCRIPDENIWKERMKRAHEICPYSKAIAGNVQVNLKVKPRIV